MMPPSTPPDDGHDRIPIGTTAAEPLQFIRYRWKTVLKTLLAPVLLGYVVLVVATGAIIDPALLSVERENFGVFEALRTPIWLAAPIAVFVALLAQFLQAGATASIIRLVALGEAPPKWYRFRTDEPAQRVFWAGAVLLVLTLGLWGVVAVLVTAVTGQSPLAAWSVMVEIMSQQASGATVVVLSPESRAILGSSSIWLFLMLGLVGNIVLSVRLAPFIAGAAVENRLILLKSIRMTRGYIGKILFALILFGLVLTMFSAAISIASQIITGVGTAFQAIGGPGTIFGALLLFIPSAMQFCAQILTIGAQAAFTSVVYRRLETGV